MASLILYEDAWGEIIDRPTAGYIEIRWYDATEDMTGDEFNQWLSTFAGYVEQQKRAGGLVDSVQFRMPLERMSLGWRDENIIPRYHAAGIQKFAFIMPSGMPLIDKTPTPEGSAQFPTGYFDKRIKAVEWLSSLI